MLSPLARLRREIWLGVGLVNGASGPAMQSCGGSNRVRCKANTTRLENQTATLENCHLRPTTYFLTSCLQGPLRLADIDAETPETGNRIHYFDRVSRCQGP